MDNYQIAFYIFIVLTALYLNHINDNSPEIIFLYSGDDEETKYLKQILSEMKDVTIVPTNNSETVKNKLWCSICTNYIKCVYNQPDYNNDAELKAKKDQKADKKKKAEEDKAAAEKAEEDKAAAEKAAAEEAAKKKAAAEEAAKKKAAEAAKKKAAEAAKKKAPGSSGGAHFSQKKTISKKQLQLFKPNRKVSIKLH